jgi:sulfofructose kinase
VDADRNKTNENRFVLSALLTLQLAATRDEFPATSFCFSRRPLSLKEDEPAAPFHGHRFSWLFSAPRRLGGENCFVLAAVNKQPHVLVAAPARCGHLRPILKAFYNVSYMSQFDIVGVGLNATDTLLIVPHFPAYAGKVPFQEEILSPGGQVASALVACAHLGLRAKYIGTIGDDERGRIQMESLKGTGINLDDVQLRHGCPNQSAYIVIDRSTGERTVFWRRDDCLRIDPEEIKPEQITCARLLHIDGHDTPAVARAASIARAHGIPVTVDVDTIYHGFDRVLPNIDYLVASSEFPTNWTGVNDPFQALEAIQTEYGMRVAATTLGAHGSLARESGRFYYSPAYVVNCVDTTGAGDVFHGAFCYAVLQGMPMRDALEFSNAMAALNCTALGARGGVRGLDEIRALMSRAERRSHPDFAARAAANS